MNLKKYKVNSKGVNIEGKYGIPNLFKISHENEILNQRDDGVFWEGGGGGKWGKWGRGGWEGGRVGVRLNHSNPLLIYPRLVCNS